MMAKSLSFQTELASIMELMTKTAMEQICRVVDTDFAFLRQELSRVMCENKILTEKLLWLEAETEDSENKTHHSIKNCRSVGIQTGEINLRESANNIDCPSINGVFGKEWCISLWKAEDPREETFTDAVLNPPILDERAEKEEETTVSISIKEENMEEETGFRDLRRERENRDARRPCFSPECESLSADTPETGVLEDFQCVQRRSNGDSTEYDKDDVPTESAEEEKTGLIDSQSVASQPVFIDRVTVSTTETEQTLSGFSKVDITQQPNDQNQKKAKLTCSECGKTFKRQSNFTTHMRSHYKQKTRNYISQGKKARCCEHCGKEFSSLTNLKDHYVVHTGEKPYRCNVCGKSFSKRGNLNVHQRIHTGEKPFACSACGKCFTQKINLLNHMSVHTQPKKRTKTRSVGQTWCLNLVPVQGSIYTVLG